VFWLIADNIKRKEQLHKDTFNFAENYRERQAVGMKLLTENCKAYQSFSAMNLAERASVTQQAFSYNLS